MTNVQFCRTRSPQRLRGDQKGVIIILVAMLFPVLLGFAGLALDIGMVYDWKRRQKQAAIAGAMGAAHERVRFATVAEAIEIAKEDTARNNFDDASATRDITVEVNIPPLSGAYFNDDEFVEVIITENVPSYFGRLFQDSVTVRSRAVAGMRPYADGCVIALEPTAEETFVASGSVTLTATCGIIVNSTHEEAMVTNGQPSCVTATSIGVTGGYTNRSNTPCIHPYPVKTPPIVDPLAYLVEPAQGNCIEHNYNHSSGAVTMVPGRYCGTPENVWVWDPILLTNVLEKEYRASIQISGGPVTLSPGVYYLDSGMKIEGNTFIYGEGVTFFNTNKQENSVRDAWVPIQIGGDVTFEVYAPTEGDYAGVLFWGDDDAPEFDNDGERNFSEIAGNANSIFGGTIYFPATQIRWAGTSVNAEWTQIVADTIKIVGNAEVPGVDLNGGTIPVATKKVTLVE